MTLLPPLKDYLLEYRARLEGVSRDGRGGEKGRGRGGEAGKMEGKCWEWERYHKAGKESRGSFKFKSLLFVKFLKAEKGSRNCFLKVYTAWKEENVQGNEK